MPATHFRKTCNSLILLVGIALSAPVAAQVDVASAQIHLREAGQAYRDGDLDAFTRSLETARNLNPYSLTTRYNLACAYARTGRQTEALLLLEGLVAERVDFGMAGDPDLESLRDLPQFSAMLGKIDKDFAPISNSNHEFTVDQLGIVPEGIAIDSATSRTFFGSMRNGDIFVVAGDGKPSKFATVEHEGTLAAIGMTVDDKDQILWVVGTSFNLNENFDVEAPVRSGVFGFDLASGRLKKKIMAANPRNGFNDLTIAPSGDMYVTGDTLSVVRAGTDRIAPLATSLPIVGSNGVAVSPDEKRMYVTSYPVGIAVVELASGDTSWLIAPTDHTFYGMDGLYWHEGDLVGVQNGVQPWRLLRIDLAENGTMVSAVRMLEFANEAITPTTAAIVGDVVHYIGEGPSPENLPAGFPAELARNAGKTIVMSAPLN